MSYPPCYSARMKINQNLWSALETSLDAIPSVWRERTGAQFDIIRRAFLQTRTEPAQIFPCRKCGCSHDVTIHAPGDIVAVCRCDPWACDEIVLTAADIEILDLNWSKLARALCKAFGLDHRPADLPFHNTRQIGSWSADAVPVILTIQSERYDFQHVVMGLAARLRRKFILLAPTSDNLDAISQEILANAGAAFFALDSHVRLTQQGSLQSVKTPGELFAQFTPQPKEAVSEDVARQAFALIQQLDAGGRREPPAVLTVFRLYCMEEMTSDQIAQKCRCSKGTVISRLKLIRAKTGVDPEDFRRLSSHFEKIEEDLTDSRAERVHRKSAIYGEDEETE